MSFLPDAFFCDACGAQKREVNHWWNIDMQGFISGTPEDHATADTRLPAFMLVPFNAELARQDDIKSACGQLCAHKIMDEYMSQLLIECK